MGTRRSLCLIYFYFSIFLVLLPEYYLAENVVFQKRLSNNHSSDKLTQSVTQNSVDLNNGSGLSWRCDKLENDTKMVEYSTSGKKDAEIADVYTGHFREDLVSVFLVDHQEVRTVDEEDSSYTVKWEDKDNIIVVAKYAFFINSKGKFKLNGYLSIISGNKDKLYVNYNIVINFLLKNNATHWRLQGVDLVLVDTKIEQSLNRFLPVTTGLPMEGPRGANLDCHMEAIFKDDDRAELWQTDEGLECINRILRDSKIIISGESVGNLFSLLGILYLVLYICFLIWQVYIRLHRESVPARRPPQRRG